MPNIKNIEIKARCEDHEAIREVLRQQGAEFKGVDHQIDTYFKTPNGRLKLREGNIEHHLIYYDRPNQKQPGMSDCLLYRPSEDPTLKEILERSMSILAIVDKHREIYYIRNIKIHLDMVKELGKFVEIEAADHMGELTSEELEKQCKILMELFMIKDNDLIDVSYSDMIMQKNA